MKIVYLHQYFNLPEQGGSLRSYYITKALVEAGHEVHMITTHNEPISKTVQQEGFTIHYLPIPYQNAFGFWQRVKAFFYFAQASYKQAQKLPTPDCVYATSTPLTVGLSAWWLKKYLKIPYIFEVRDLWPLVPIALGILRNPIGKWLARYMEKKIYQNATRIITLSPAMQAHVKAIVPQKDVLMIPNMADLPTQTLPTQTLPEKFVVAYLGTIGYANHLEYLVEIAREAQKQQLTSLEFWIVGKGARQTAIEKLAKEYELHNLRIFPHQGRQDIEKLMTQIQAMYSCFLDNTALTTTSPNKFFDALAYSKLCLVNTKGWLQDLVEHNQCGFYASPHDPQDFLDKLKPFLQDLTLLTQYQQNARKLAENQFSVADLTKKIVKIVSM